MLCAFLIWQSLNNFFLSVVAPKTNIIIFCRSYAWMLCASLIWLSFIPFYASICTLAGLVLGCYVPFFFSFITFSGSSCTKKTILRYRPCAWMLSASLIWLCFISFSCSSCTKQTSYSLAGLVLGFYMYMYTISVFESVQDFVNVWVWVWVRPERQTIFYEWYWVLMSVSECNWV